MNRWAVGAVVGLALVGGVVAALDGGDPPDAAPPAGVTALVQQYRSDQIPHRLQITVTNRSRQTLRVDAAELVTGRYPSAPTWRERDAADVAVFAPGQTIDLPAPLTDPRCPPSGSLAPAVRLHLADRDSWVRMPAADPDASLARVSGIDCVKAASFAIASVQLRPVLIGGLGRPGTIEVRLTPTGATGTLVIESVGTTTLLSPAPGHSWRVRQPVSAGTGPVTLRLPVSPTRCDPHAVAEDKVGTLLPFRVRVDGGPAAVLTVPPAPAVQQSVYTFVNATCGPADQRSDTR